MKNNRAISQERVDDGMSKQGFQEKNKSPALEERMVGSIVGFAIGDALGAPVEFMKNRPVIAGFEPSYKKGLKAGQYTDDTQHLEIALDACLEAQGRIDVYAQARKLMDWYTSGNARSMGRTTESALKNLLKGISPLKSGINRTDACSSLAIARVLPYALVSAITPFTHKLTRADTRKILGITHAHRNVLQMGELVNYLVQEVMHGKDTEQTIDMILFEDNFLSRRIRDKLRVVKDLSESDEEQQSAMQKIGNSGFVEDVVFSALYAVIKNESFKEAVITSANAGGDSDSRAALTGSLYGLQKGVQGIPPKWIKGLERNDELIEKAKRLSKLQLRE